MHGVTLKVRNVIARTLLRSILRPGPVDGLDRLGTDYGGWWVPREVLVPGAVAYCAGAGEDISFDVALADRGLLVRTFDPTPRAADYVRRLAPKNVSFYPIGWWDESTTLRFYAPRNPSHVSHSALNLQGTEQFFEAPVEPVRKLMEELGDQRVEIIKMDIEGAETRVIPSLLQDGPLPMVLCVEFDQPQPLRQLLGLVRGLRAAGYTLRLIEKWNYTFTR